MMQSVTPGEVSVPGIIETALLSSPKLRLLTIPSLGINNIFLHSLACECQTLCAPKMLGRPFWKGKVVHV